MKNIKLSEAQIQKQIISYLQVKRILFNRVNNGQFSISEQKVDKYNRQRNLRRMVRCNTLNGIADIEIFACLLKDGQPILEFPIYLEVKAHKGRQSDHQKKFEKLITSSGGYYFIVRSLEDVTKAFESVEESIVTKFSNDFRYSLIKDIPNHKIL